MDKPAARRAWTDLQKAEAQVDILTRRVADLETKLSTLREASDDLWYCIRHRAKTSPADFAEAVDDYTVARDISFKTFNP